MRDVQRRTPRRATATIRIRALALGCRAALPLAALITATSPAVAQSAQPNAQPTRLGDLYAQVQRGNPRIVAARELVAAARARVSGVSRPPDPQLQLGF